VKDKKRMFLTCWLYKKSSWYFKDCRTVSKA